MKKNKSRTLCIIDEYDDNEKEVYLGELSDSVRNYIRTGVKNRQLEDIDEVEQDFHERYERIFWDNAQIDRLIQYSKTILGEIDKTYTEMLESLKNRRISPETYAGSVEALQKSNREWIENLTENFNESLKQIVKDTAYLSNMNMVYEIYNREQCQRREEEGYRKTTKKYPKISDISKTLNTQRHMGAEQLQEQVHVSGEELELIVSRNGKYFNVRKKSDSFQISLSPAGRNYYNYMMNTQKECSWETLNQQLYKTADNIMEAFENSYDRKMKCELKLEGISPEKERALQSKYQSTVEKLLWDSEYSYHCPQIRTAGEKVSVNRENEKNRFTIPRWND